MKPTDYPRWHGVPKEQCRRFVGAPGLLARMDYRWTTGALCDATQPARTCLALPACATGHSELEDLRFAVAEVLEEPAERPLPLLARQLAGEVLDHPGRSAE